MKKQIFFILFQLLLFSSATFAQKVMVEGYVFQDNNRGFLNEVEVKVLNVSDNSLVAEALTNVDGFFSVELPANQEFIVKVNKDLFFPKEEMASTKGKTAGEKVYLKIKMERKPGYIFDVTLAEKGAPKATVNAITGAQIEVYNNTKLEETLVIDSLASINFDVTFERGNHYTVLIRKEGFFNKRLEAYVDVEGCILCFEGVGTVTPGVSDVMSEGFQMGSVLANIELDPARLNQTMKVDNIYYDLNKYEIRKDAALELDKVVTLLKENPSVIIELGSHTDSRGGSRHNKQLSTNRAKAAVKYITTKGGISNSRITAKGYGETVLVNKCVDGVKCSEEEHQLNRRTELKVVGFEEIDPSISERSLADILTEERLLREIENSGQIQVAPGQAPPNFDKAKKATTSSKIKTSSKSKKTTIQANTSQVETKMPEVGATQIKKTIPTANKPSTTIQKEAVKEVKKEAGSVVEKGTSTAVSSKNRGDIPNFDANQVLIISNGQLKFLPKIIDTQLNTEITDLLIGKFTFLESKDVSVKFNVADINSMPPPLLNAFLKKVAMVEKVDGWHLYSIEKGAGIPQGLKDALK